MSSGQLRDMIKAAKLATDEAIAQAEGEKQDGSGVDPDGLAALYNALDEIDAAQVLICA